MSEGQNQNALAPLQEAERALAPAAAPVVKLGRLSAMRRPISWVLRGLGGLAAALLILGAIGYFRLSQGPISLQFLVSPIEQSLNRELLDVSVKVRDAVLRRSARGGVEFRLTNVVLSDADGVPIALAPLAAIEISGLALMRGQIAASRIDLIGARMLLLQGQDGNLSLQFSKTVAAVPAPVLAKRPVNDAPTQSQNASANQTQGQGQEQIAAAQIAVPIVVPSGLLGDRIDLVRTIVDATAKARARTTASSFLRAIGLRQTTVIFDKLGQRSVWHVPDFDISFRHSKTDSVIHSSAVVDTARGPWNVNLNVEDSEKSQFLIMSGKLANLVPRTLARTLPQFSFLEMFDLPLNGKSSVKLSRDGQILSADMALQLGSGKLRFPANGKAALEIESGNLNFSYDAKTGVVEIAPSRLQWAGSFITLSGQITPTQKQDGHDVWKFDLKAIDGALAASERASGRASVGRRGDLLPIKQMSLHGWITPDLGRVQLGQFYINIDGAEIALAADMVDIGAQTRARLEGRIGAMSLKVLKAIWPPGLASDAREYIAEHLVRARVNSGVIKYTTGNSTTLPGSRRAGTGGRGGAAQPGALSLTLKLSKLALSVYDRGPLLRAPRALLRLQGKELEVSVPQARIKGRGGKDLSLSAGRLLVADLLQDIPSAVVEFRAGGRVRDALALAQTDPINLIKSKDVALKQLGGTFKGQLKIRLPLRDDMQIEEMKVEGTVKIVDGKYKIPDSPVKVSSIAMKIDISPRAVHVGGQMLMNGVVARVNWQRIFGLPADKQPAMRLRASLDDADRVQLGMDVNHLITGIVPVSVSINNAGANNQTVHLTADLAQAELRLKSMAWLKPRGRKAILQFDVGKGSAYPYELQNFKLVGDNVAIDGWMALDRNFKAREFYFPEFSVNVVTRMEVQGALSKANIWKINATGATFDGRDFFSSLFDVDATGGAKKQNRKNVPGIDLIATIDNVIGYGDISLREFKVKLRERGNKLTFIEAQGKLDGAASLSVKLNPKKGQKRILFAQTSRAGKAFKMVGFYPNLRKGQATLKVNLDGKGVAETTGQLEVRKFFILGDQVISEVLQSIDEGRPAIASRRSRRVERERFDFDSLSVPFSVGQGQFVITNSSIKGPVIGASMRGKVDFKARRLNLGGTYVPLSGLNSAFCQIPLLGQLLTGPRCEGVFGITFAVKGKLGNPEVIVNPLSMLTPGFLRELMALTPLNPTIKKRGGSAKSKRRKRSAARSSSSAVSTRKSRRSRRAKAKADGPEVIDGWSAKSTPNR